jgi:formate-dependent nitrite reductase cytochrome c552 subunit
MMKLLLLAIVLTACGSKDSIEQLQDPATCMECHPKHYQQWSGSMHAYASDDPVFIALNTRGQRETDNKLGTFCVQCHAPMAVQLGLVTKDNAAAFDPAALPPTARGITCYFCHNVASVAETHNNGLVLAMDDVMRGGAKNPVDSPAHNSAYDKLMASTTNNSTMCGSCHDVVTPRGVALERTFTEWKDTIFAQNDPMKFFPLTCSGCHMQGSTEVIADKPGLNVPSRYRGFHSHLFPAVDQALTPFPELDAQAAGVKDILDPALTIVGVLPRGELLAPGGICLDPPGILTVRMDTIMDGHMFPSGAAQDRRVWLEVIAYRADNTVLFESGRVPDGMDPEDINDPNLVGFWDETYKADNTPAHFFWDVANYTSKLLKPPVTSDPNSSAYDHSTTASFIIGGNYPQVDRITARIRMRPLAYRILDDLVMSGDLDPSIAGNLKTLDSVGASKVWTKATKGTGSAKLTNCNPYP